MSDTGLSHSSHRHRAREVAIQALYALDLQRIRVAADAARRMDSEPLEEIESRRVFDGVADHFEMPAAVREFAQELVVKVGERGEEIDATLSSHTKNWRVSRMAAVDRNILRLATYELSYTDTPAAVILDEAVELARRFGSDPSPGFVNGVLDAVARKLRDEIPQ